MKQELGSFEVPPANIQSPADLKHWLITNGIDTSSWGYGQAKTVEHLWQELQEQEVFLKNDPPLRIGSVIKVIIRKDDRVLIEAEQVLNDNRVRPRNRPPTEKMKPSESYYDAVHRCLREELGITEGNKIEIIASTYQKREEVTESPSYPGLFTKYILHTVEAKVLGLPDSDFRTQNPSDLIKEHYWVWKTFSPEVM